MNNEELLTNEERIRKTFLDRKISINNMEVKPFPGETIYIIYVNDAIFDSAIKIANFLDSKIEDGFITVRKSREKPTTKNLRAITGIDDPVVTDLIELLNERSRTSETQPSLGYIKDAQASLNLAVSNRHHLLFGRRGVGKTALMVEAKRLVEARGAKTFWINLQTIRGLSAFEAFLEVARRLSQLPSLINFDRQSESLSVREGRSIADRIDSVSANGKINKKEIHRIIPRIQNMLKLLCAEIQTDVFLFLDDIHYVSMQELPLFLDMVHATTRDNSVWIKAAAIRHQCRWFTDTPPTGLQIGHDAAEIDLDITLEDPEKARIFLLSVLKSYTDEVGISNLSSVVSSFAVDRLVLASGGVPRDFLLLSAGAVQFARERTNARTAGGQDVNEAAGRAAATKLEELEEDAASAVGSAAITLRALQRVRSILLEEEQSTYFRIDFHDKEEHPKLYNLLQGLMDLRLIHLVKSSLSDERRAGRRFEVYMLDLSQFAGSRLRRHLKVLDFRRSHLVLKETGTKNPAIIGNTPNRLLALLRRGPLFELSEMDES